MQQPTEDTPVKLTNHGSGTYSFGVRDAGNVKQTYTINPGETVFWTWRVARYFLGDPFLTDTDSLPELSMERNRVHDKWGRVLDPESYTPPNVTVESMTGERIPMAIETEINPIVHAPSLDAGDLQARMEQLQAELDILRANTADPTPPAVSTEVDTSPDTATSLDDIPDDAPIPMRLSGQPRTTPRPAPPRIDLPTDA